MEQAKQEHEQTCAERVDAHLEGRMEDLRLLWAAYQDGDEDRHSGDLGNIYEYGLCFDYVAPGTFDDQPRGYFRWVLSTGGPGDEFRLYVDIDRQPYRVDYTFLDWFDGATVTLEGENLSLLRELWAWLDEGGAGLMLAPLPEVIAFAYGIAIGAAVGAGFVLAWAAAPRG